MKRVLLFALFVVLWTANSFGQLVTLPIAASPNPICAAYLTMELTAHNQCGSVSYSAWVATGNGWASDVSLANTGTKPVTYNVFVLPGQGMAATVSANVRMSILGSPSIAAQTALVTLNPNASTDINITSDVFQTGSVEVLVLAPDAATLDAQKAAQLTFIYTPADGSPTWQVAVPLVRDSDATVAWGSQFTETPVAMKANNPASNNTSFAVLNDSIQTQSVRFTISDSNNNPIVSAQTVLLAPGATTGIVLSDMFGSTMFPKIISPDGLFHGNISFQGMGGGKIIPLVLRAIGNSISSMQAWQTSSN